MRRIIDEHLVQLPLSVTEALKGIKVSDTRCVIIPGTPKGKGRPRMTRRGQVYTPSTTATVEALVKAIAIAQCSKPPSERAVRLELLAVTPVPKSWSKAKRTDALAGAILPTVTPDFDNIAKLYCDALNGLFWKDDKQIVDGRCIKCYGENPAVLLWCWEVG